MPIAKASPAKFVPINATLAQGKGHVSAAANS